MGRLLHEVRERQLQGDLTTPAEARAWAGQWLSEQD
jgi:hypothetical protein